MQRDQSSYRCKFPARRWPVLNRQRLYHRLYSRIRFAKSDSERRRALQNFRRHFKPRAIIPAFQRKSAFSLYNQRWYRNRRRQFHSIKDAVLGEACFICGRRQSKEYKDHIHRKDGRPHSYNRAFMMSELKEHPDRYVRLCPRCHARVHWAMKSLGMSWKEIERRLGAEARKNSPCPPQSKKVVQRIRLQW